MGDLAYFPDILLLNYLAYSSRACLLPLLMIIMLGGFVPLSEVDPGAALSLSDLSGWMALLGMPCPDLEAPLCAAYSAKEQEGVSSSVLACFRSFSCCTRIFLAFALISIISDYFCMF